MVFSLLTVLVIYAGVQNGVERVSKVMMPVLVVLSIIIAVYSITRPGALTGVKYFLVPNLEHFSWMTVVSAMGQMFYSPLSIAMGILVTLVLIWEKDISIEESTTSVEIFDTAIAIMAGLMIIPAVFAFSGGDPNTLNAGPSSCSSRSRRCSRAWAWEPSSAFCFCAGAVCGTDQLHRADGEWYPPSRTS